MELKGQIVKKLKPEQKEKMQKTLDRMEQTRLKVDKYLLEKLKDRLNWLQSEHTKGLKDLNLLRERLIKIEGAIEILQDILKDYK